MTTIVLSLSYLPLFWEILMPTKITYKESSTWLDSACRPYSLPVPGPKSGPNLWIPLVLIKKP